MSRSMNKILFDSCLKIHASFWVAQQQFGSDFFLFPYRSILGPWMAMLSGGLLGGVVRQGLETLGTPCAKPPKYMGIIPSISRTLGTLEPCKPISTMECTR